MSVFLAIVITTSAVAVPRPVPLVERLEHRSGPVRLGEVADLAPLPSGLRERASKLQIAVIRSVKESVSIPHRQIAARARAMLPALGPWLVVASDDLLLINTERSARRLPTATSASGDVIVAREPVVATVSAGIFRIHREGIALQDAAPGERLFVRTPDGVITALCCGSK